MEKSIIGEDEYNYKLEIEITSKTIPMYDFINSIKNEIDNKYNKSILGEDYYEWIIDDENVEYDKDDKDYIKQIKSKPFKIGCYNWYFFFILFNIFIIVLTYLFLLIVI